ncbi:MAG: glycosyltransferase family 9 protein [Chlorobi bacterium]|nr:glycosyltransferase family 9 protein [Chlorobiota bacterium]
MSKQRRILIVRHDRMGDAILATPIPRELKKTFPDAFIAVLVREYTESIFVNNPYVDEILTLAPLKTKGFWNAVKTIRKYRFTDALMLLPNEWINYLLFFAGIKTRVGVGRKFYQTITFTKEVSRNKYIPLRHEADYCMDLARAIGVETFNIKTEIHFSDDEKKQIEKLKKEYAPNGEKIIAVHTDDGGSSPNISAAEYKKLIGELLELKNVKVALTTFKPPEKLKEIPGVLYLAKDKRQFLIDIAAFDLLISSSTGPSHVAAAVGVKTLTLFCRLSANSPQLWSPVGNDAYYILPEEKYCKNNCPVNPDDCRFEGEGGISGEKIVSETMKILSIQNNIR